MASTPQRLLSILATIVVVAALWAGQEVLIPFALAIVLSLILGPLVDRLERLRFGRVGSVVIVVTLACAALGAAAWFFIQELTELVAKLPEYKANIVAKIGSLRGGMIEKASDAVKELGAGLQASSQPFSVSKPVPEVKVVQNEPTGVAAFGGAFASLMAPLGTLSVVLVLATFMLVYREDLRDRVIQLIGDGRVNLTTQAMNEISSRVSRYLLMQTLLNVVHGTAVGVGLWLLGMPDPLFWGIVSAALRFIPYVGPIVAASLPIILAMALFEGWGKPLSIVGCFVAIELVSNNVLEPWLYGSSAGVSSFAVIASAVFWTWLWGPVGLLLATPMTVCLVVIGKHVRHLAFLNVLFGEESSLDPGVRFYQRMLAMDQDELAVIAEKSLAESGSFVTVCDQIVLPAIRLAEHDRHHDEMAAPQLHFVETALPELIEELAESARKLRAEGAEQPRAITPITVLCVPAKNELDQIAAQMLAQALAEVGIRAEVVAADALASEKATRVEEHAADVVCISALPAEGLASARYVGKRLRARLPELELVVCSWGSALDPVVGRERVRIGGPCAFVTTIAEAVHAVEQLVEPVALRQATPA